MVEKKYIHYIKNKREKKGKCNICLQNKNLSWDHVPPKGGIELSSVEIESIFQIFTNKDNKREFIISQNGVKYRTICKECNEFLGSKYDTVINEFALGLGRYLNSNLEFPKIIKYKTKPGAIIRGILGHLLSAKIEIDNCQFDSIARNIVLNENELIPDDINIFYWIYPYNQTVIMRDIGMPAVRGDFSRTALYQILKYFPVAYLVSTDLKYEKLFSLTKYRNAKIDEEVELYIDRERIEHPHWPEIVDNRNFLLGGQSMSASLSAKPRTIKEP